MSKSSLDKDVLKLNKHWQVIGVISARQAFEDMAAGSVVALNCDEGALIPTNMKDWMLLHINEGDDFISTTKQQIRLPRVVIASKFGKVFVTPPKLTLKNLRIRDKDTCIYTGKKLKTSEMSIEHIVPTSKNGKNEWENVGLAHKDVNSKRGNKELTDVGLTLRFKPFAPRGKKPAELIENKHSYPEWVMFLNK